MSPKQQRRAVIYTRISVATEKSVSVERQIESARQYAAARGWEVVGDPFVDEGVSATHNKPTDRKGWRALMASPDDFDTVIIWKLDRLARRVIDFHLANESLQERGAALVAVENSIDMATSDGRLVANVLASFAEYEAEAIRARVKAARAHLLQSGRYVGGAVLYGYKAVPNPDGPGYVVVQDPEQIGYVREMAERTAAGRSIYSTMQWLDEVGAPTKTGAESWSYGTVDRIVRHPLLAGMTPHNPGHVSADKARGDDVVRDPATGLPVIDETLAVMPVGEWRAMQARLADPNSRRTPRALRRQHSGVLSGLMWCGDPRHDEPVRMWRGTVGSSTGPRPAYTCPECHQTLSNAEHLIVERFLAERGETFHLGVVEEVVEGGSVAYQEATVRLAELGRELAGAEGERFTELLTELTRLKELQAEAKHRPAQVVMKERGGTTRTFTEDWADATDDETRRDIIGDALDRVVVRRGGRGAWTDAAKLARCTFEWHPAGQVDTPTDQELARWSEGLTAR